MLRQTKGGLALAALLLALTGLSACEGAPPTAPQLEQLAVPASAAPASAAFVERGRFTDFPPPLPVNAPCVDNENPITMMGPWTGWYQLAQTARGHVHITEHIDWAGVTLVAMDGRTWKPGPGAHESFNFNLPATDDDSGETANTVMHNLRARFNSQDGDSDLQVWHTIHVVRGPDLEFRVLKMVLPFEAFCIGGSK